MEINPQLNPYIFIVFLAHTVLYVVSAWICIYFYISSGDKWQQIKSLKQVMPKIKWIYGFFTFILGLFLFPFMIIVLLITTLMKL